jgi:hypothetical protein
MSEKETLLEGHTLLEPLVTCPLKSIVYSLKKTRLYQTRCTWQ